MNFSKRIKQLQNYLPDSIDALLIEDKIGLYYLTGLELSAGKLFILKQATYLFVDGRYIEKASHASPCTTLLLPEGGLKGLFETKELKKIKQLGFVAETTSFKHFQELEKHKKLQPISNPLVKMRMLKNKQELSILKKAAKLGSEGYDFVLSLLEEGISEKEVAQELEIFWLRSGGKGVAFEPIIAFGANSSMPHYHSGETHLKKGDTVLIDIGVTLQHYHSDMTRTCFFGKPDPKMASIYAIVKKAQQRALKACRPGVSISELDATARDYITNQGYGHLFLHSLGHGIGLEVHEAPLIRRGEEGDKVYLEPGMVITIEPGIYLPGLGGIRIEDTVIITEDGYEDLTGRSKELKIL